MDKEEKILGIKDTELNDLIIKNFTRYNEVYKSLAEKERREELDKIIDEHFIKYDDVFKALAEL